MANGYVYVTICCKYCLNTKLTNRVIYEQRSMSWTKIYLQSLKYNNVGMNFDPE